jgi:hypothetical protein
MRDDRGSLVVQQQPSRNKKQVNITPDNGAKCNELEKHMLGKHREADGASCDVAPLLRLTWKLVGLARKADFRILMPLRLTFTRFIFRRIALDMGALTMVLCALVALAPVRAQIAFTASAVTTSNFTGVCSQFCPGPHERSLLELSAQPLGAARTFFFYYTSCEIIPLWEAPPGDPVHS